MQIEFYLDKTGTFKKVIYFKLDHTMWRPFEDLTNDEVEMIFNHMIAFEKARKALMHLSRCMNGAPKRKLLQQFILCNWTILDNRMDISNEQLSFERIDCHFKSSGNCPYNLGGLNGAGTVCIKI